MRDGPRNPPAGTATLAGLNSSQSPFALKHAREPTITARRPDFDSCIPGAVIVDVGTGEMWPLRCGQWDCLRCGPSHARAVRVGLYRACLKFGMRDVITLTLGSTLHDVSSLESRTAASAMWNAFRTLLRKRGFLGHYCVIPEWHQDGTCHLHVAANIEGLLAAEGWDYGAVQAWLSKEWAGLGGGFVWYAAGSGREHSERYSAAYLSKYLSKAQVQRPPWDDSRWCTERGGFRKRPWHRYWCDRETGSVISPKGPSKVTVDMERLVSWLLSNSEMQRATEQVEREAWSETFGLLKDAAPDVARRLWAGLTSPERTRFVQDGMVQAKPILARVVSYQDGRFGWAAWEPPPGLGTTIIVACDGHDVDAEWVSGSCHHDMVEGGLVGMCMCSPPWASDIYTEAETAHGWARLALERYKRHREQMARPPEADVPFGCRNYESIGELLDDYKRGREARSMRRQERQRAREESDPSRTCGGSS